jgi:hypothetical protein
MRLKLTRSDLATLGVLFTVGALSRMVYLFRMVLPDADPWRHLQLVENIRAGLGFTLFDGQPYFWYSPVWYQLIALLPASIPLAWPATLLSALCVPLFYLILRQDEGEASQRIAAIGALLMAAFGPLVVFTCHYGQEAFALTLVLGALLLSLRAERDSRHLIAGLLLGVALICRMNFIFAVFLFPTSIKSPRRAAGFLGGLSLPLLWTWWRNHGIIGSYPHVFSWDGLAIRSADFTTLSTLFIQRHPSIQEGLRRLHEMIVPQPQWLSGPDGIHYGLIVFMLVGVLALIFCKRLPWILAGGATLGYLLLLDRTLSSHFFRVFLPVFPVFFMALAVAATRLKGKRLGAISWPGSVLVILVLLSGGQYLMGSPMVTLEMVTPPAELISAEAYFVNSGFYHPESLIQRYPDTQFLGLPLDPAEFPEFQQLHPEINTIVWRRAFDIQDALEQQLPEFGYVLEKSMLNPAGQFYSTYSRLAPIH